MSMGIRWANLQTGANYGMMGKGLGRLLKVGDNEKSIIQCEWGVRRRDGERNRRAENGQQGKGLADEAEA